MNVLVSRKLSVVVEFIVSEKIVNDPGEVFRTVVFMLVRVLFSESLGTLKNSW